MARCRRWARVTLSAVACTFLVGVLAYVLADPSGAARHRLLIGPVLLAGSVILMSMGRSYRHRHADHGW